MPSEYVIVGPKTVRGPDGRDHDVLEAIEALPWTPQLCPLMRHEYTIWKNGPEWAWNVLSAMLLARNAASFRAYFRGYQTANRYWDAPDGRRYWRGRFEIDRGVPDGAGQRRPDEGAEAIQDWEGPPWSPSAMGVYEQDTRGRWWPTTAAIAAGYQPCVSCELTARKSAIVATPTDPGPALSFIGSAQRGSIERLGRGLTRDELADVLRSYPDGTVGSLPLAARREVSRPVEPRVPTGMSDEIRGVVERLLDLREAEAPLGYSGYRGPFTQAVIAKIAGVPVKAVTAMAIERDRRRAADRSLG